MFVNANVRIMMNKTNPQPDPTSPYYRICPSCHTGHMVRNKSRDYCSDKCYQDFYNQTRRIKRVALMYAPPYVDTNPIQTETYREAQHKSIDPNFLQKNIGILEQLSIEGDGTKFKVHNLAEAGFEFSAHSYRYPISIERNIYCIEYGQFETLLVEPDTILIHIKN